MEPESLVIACMKEETKRIKGKEEKIEEEKSFLVNGNGCIVFVNIKMKKKEKERKTSKVDML